MSKTDDYIIDQHNREIEDQEIEEDIEKLKMEELQRELRYDIYFG